MSRLLFPLFLIFFISCVWGQNNSIQIAANQVNEKSPKSTQVTIANQQVAGSDSGSTNKANVTVKQTNVKSPGATQITVVNQQTVVTATGSTSDDGATVTEPNVEPTVTSETTADNQETEVTIPASPEAATQTTEAPEGSTPAPPRHNDPDAHKSCFFFDLFCIFKKTIKKHFEKFGARG